MNFHPAGPHNTTAYVASFTHGQNQVVMLVWARNEDEAFHFVSGHYRGLEREAVNLFRADPRHHLGANRVALNCRIPQQPSPSAE